jgi:hypothetical protein
VRLKTCPLKPSDQLLQLLGIALANTPEQPRPTCEVENQSPEQPSDDWIGSIGKTQKKWQIETAQNDHYQQQRTNR